MSIPICSKCKKRPASVFITRMENGRNLQEGLCILCAKDMGINPINGMLKQMGLNEESIENMSRELEEAIEEMSETLPEAINADDGGAPAIDFSKFFSGLGMMPNGNGGKNPQGSSKNERQKAKKEDRYKFLSLYCTNLNEKAENGKVDRIVGRDKELHRVIQILCRRQKNNPCLIGEPGVGKTAIAEALAQKIVDGSVPERLRNHQVWLLDLTALVAGTQFRGQFESRILGLIKEVKSAGNIILVIDEVHNIVGAGDSEGSMSAANILKPTLSRGEIQVIGATTLKEYRKYIEKDSALERRFQPVMVNEPSIEESVDIIKGIKSYYETYHGIKISDDAARLAVIMSERYITDRFLPDKAIDLIDEAAARLSISSAELNELRKNGKLSKELKEKHDELEAILGKPEGQTEDNYAAFADVKTQLSRIEERNVYLEEAVSKLYLSASDLANVVEIWTGIPATDIKEGELSELVGLYDRISSRVIGQEEAVAAVCRAVKRKRAGVSYRKNPVSMIFAGPTGVGKTELVKVLADELFKQPEALIRLDMSEFMEKHAVSRIIGAPPGYVGYDEAGQLTEKIRRRPYSVVLFDEIEKAHPDVLNILLQVLDDGKITDAQGRLVNFENTIIIMTTNAGSQLNSGISGFAEKRELQNKEKTEKALFGFLRPEFINRIDEIITFNHLGKRDFEKIAKIMLGKLGKALEEKGISLKYNDSILRLIAEKSYSEKFGARNMRRYIEKEIEDRIAEAIIAAFPQKLVGIGLDAKNEDVYLTTM